MKDVAKQKKENLYHVRVKPRNVDKSLAQSLLWCRVVARRAIDTQTAQGQSVQNMQIMHTLVGTLYFMEGSHEGDSYKTDDIVSRANYARFSAQNYPWDLAALPPPIAVITAKRPSRLAA